MNMRVSGNRIAQVQEQKTPVFAEIMAEFNDLATANVTSENRAQHVARYKAAMDKADNHNWGDFWNGQMKHQATKAYMNIAQPFSIGGFLRRLNASAIDKPQLNTTGTRPNPTVKIPWGDEPKDGNSVNWQNAKLTSAASMGIYEPDGVFLKTMENQGYKAPVGENQIIENQETGARAYVGTRDDSTLLTLCGTQDVQDLIADAKYAKKTTRNKYGPGKIKVHEGFDEQLDSIWPQLKTQIQAAKAADPDKPIVITGHSLGGGLAKLAMARAKHEGLIDPPSASLHTYGQPKVADEKSMAKMDAATANIAQKRFTFQLDPVTMVPPKDMPLTRDYSHGNAQQVQLGKPKAISHTNGELRQAVHSLARDLADHNEVNYYSDISIKAKQ